MFLVTLHAMILWAILPGALPPFTLRASLTFQLSTGDADIWQKEAWLTTESLCDLGHNESFEASTRANNNNSCNISA